MRVFLTGGTGLVGSHVLKELLRSGHKVLALSRSEASTAKLKTFGVDIVQGSITDMKAIKKGIKVTEATIHCAIIQNFENFAETCANEVAVVEAIGSALEYGSKKPVLITSGTALLNKPSDGPCTEEPTTLENMQFPRFGTRVAVDKLVAEKDLDLRLIRLPPSVHGEGDWQGFIPMFIKTAKEKGAAYYVGEGLNVWPAVDVKDAARLYVAALEKGRKGASYHATEDKGVTTKAIMEAIAKKVGVEAQGKPQDYVADLLGFFAIALTIDNPTSNEITKKELAWEPKEPGLLEDIENGGWYFKE